MFKFTPAAAGSPVLDWAEKLYTTAFPEHARVPFQELAGTFGKGGSLLVFYSDDTPVGFVYKYDNTDPLFVVYIAVDPAFRGKGYGSKMLNIVRSLSLSKRVFTVTDYPHEGYATEEECARLRRFYEGNGCKYTGIRLMSDGYPFETVAVKGDVSEDEMRQSIAYYEAVRTGREDGIR